MNHIVRVKSNVFVLLFVCTAHQVLATTVVLVWTPREMVVAADSAVEGNGKSKSEYCKIRQGGDTFFAVEGVADVDIASRGRTPALSFHADALAAKAAKAPGSIVDKALTFGHHAPLFKNIAVLTKQYEPEVYRRYFLGRAALQVAFFGLNQDKVPSYVVIGFKVGETDGRPGVTVEVVSCPGKGCADLRILGEGQSALELWNRSTNPLSSDLATVARGLVEAEIQDKPKLVGPPVDVLRLSVFGPSWVSVKPQCVGRNR